MELAGPEALFSTGRQMTVPNAMVVGPMKAGSTWIHDYLSARGDVGLPDEVKETFFFDKHYNRGVDWYAARFRRAAGHLHPVTIEVAPSLFHHPNAPARVRATLGDIPIVVTTRDPVERSWSHYLHLRRYGFTRSPLEDAVAHFPEIISASRYVQMIARWCECFDIDRITVLRLEQLKTDPEGYAGALCSALSLPGRLAPDAMLQRANEKAEAPSYMLAKVGQTLSDATRSAGFYGAVNLAKRFGLKTLFFGRPSNRTAGLRPTEAQVAFLQSRIGITAGGQSSARARLSSDFLGR